MPERERRSTERDFSPHGVYEKDGVTVEALRWTADGRPDWARKALREGLLSLAPVARR